MYSTAFAGAGTAFVFCSFWVYHYVQLDLDADGTGDYDRVDDNGSDEGLNVMLMPFSREVTATFASSSKTARRKTDLSESPRPTYA
jgi:hypothetical protein